MWLQAPNIPVIHGFSARHGGVSPPPFGTLNLGGSQDDPENIRMNRRRALGALGLDVAKLCMLRQVHSDIVCEASAAQQEGDALVSSRPDDIIAVLVADCFPLLLCDPVNGVIGAAHCGWRGTLAGIAAKTVERMSLLGAEPRHIHAAIGQGISQENFEVGEEVISAFEEAGYPHKAVNGRKLDLSQCILFNLMAAGLAEKNTWMMNRCTFEDDFFSHRRDKGQTGRMMALINLRKQ